MKELFEKISKEENGELSINFGPSYSKLITFSQFLDDDNTGKKVTSLSMEINYRNQTITVSNKMGIHQGELKCILEQKLKLPDFNVSTRNWFYRVLKKSFNLLKVECDDKIFKDFVQAQLLNLELEGIARGSKFEPIIKGNKKDVYEISTVYNLLFAKKKEVIRPLINFNKLLIDFCLDNKRE